MAQLYKLYIIEVIIHNNILGSTTCNHRSPGKQKQEVQETCNFHTRFFFFVFLSLHVNNEDTMKGVTLSLDRDNPLNCDVSQTHSRIYMQPTKIKGQQYELENLVNNSQLIF